MSSIPSTPSDTDQASWTIDELASKANDALASTKTSTTDSRMVSQLTVRNLRRMVSTGAVEPAARVGREAYYGPKHLDQILSARELMSQGFTSSSIQAMRAAIGAAEPASRGPMQDQAPLSPSLDHAAFFAAPSLDAGMPQSFFHSTPDALGAAAPAAWLESAPAPSTANALQFLSQLGAGGAASSLSASAPSSRLIPEGRSGLLSSLERDLSQRELAAKSLSGSLPGAELAKAYQNLGAQKTAEPPARPTLAQTFEAEPFAGLRISARSQPGMGPLTDEQRRAIVERAEQLWDAARGASS